MERRGFVAFLALVMLLAIIPIQGVAADTMTIMGTEDWVNGKSYLVTEYNEKYEENVSTYFSFNIPEHGATVLLFYDIADQRSQNLFRQLNNADWLDNEYVNVVALESQKHYGYEVEQFRNTYAPNTAEKIRWAWDAYGLVQRYGLAYFEAECRVNIAYPFVLVITGEENDRTIHSGDVYMDSADKLYNSLCNASSAFAGGGSQEPSGETVTVTVAGSRDYDMARHVRELVNTQRSANGKCDLILNGTLTELAMRRAAEIALYYDHERPSGLRYNTVMEGKYFGYTVVGENIAWGQKNATAVMDAWMNSEGHRANILYADYTQIGVGCYYSNGSYYWVQLFGNSTTDRTTTTQAGSVNAPTEVTVLSERLQPNPIGTVDALLEMGTDHDIILSAANMGAEKASAWLDPVKIQREKSTVVFVEYENGSLRLHPIAPGSDTVTVYYYEGQTDPLVLNVTVEPKHTHTFGLWIIDSESVLNGADGTKHRVCECGEIETATYSNPLADVPNGKYFSKPIFWAYENGITKGKTATEFQKDLACTRKQIVTFLWRAAGQPEPESMDNPFVDVKRGDQFEKAILWAYYSGITKGTDNTHFSPENPCTRKQIVMFLWRFNECPEPESMDNPFVDVKRGDQFEKAILWALGEGITTGKTKTTFEPEEPCTRGQIVTFLYRSMVKE